jgi:hypothetical protein
MSLELTAALTAAIEADLAEAAVKFPDASLTWKWKTNGETTLQFFSEFDDSERDLKLVIQIGLTAGPTLDYTTASFWLQDVTTVSATQTVTNVVYLPAPSTTQRAGFTSMTPVLAYVAAWRDRLAGP